MAQAQKAVIEVTRNENENPASVIRRFSRRVQSSGILRRARSLRFRTRGKSELLKKRNAIRRINKKRENEKLQKLGKITEEKKGRFERKR